MSWIILDRELDVSDYFGVAGRALFVSQHFEAVCKDIVIWLSLAKAIDEKQFAFLGQEHLDYVQRLKRFMLGPAIKHLHSTFGLTLKEESLATLDAAREGRNYICHEAVQAPAFSYHNPRAAMETELDNLHPHVEAVALGDYLVSLWSFSFHERKEMHSVRRDDYVCGLLGWVFRPVV